MSKLGTITNPRTVAGEACRAIRARIWNSDIRKGRGGYSILADHAAKMIEILGDAATTALQAAGFQELKNGDWCTRFRTEKGGEAYVYLTPPFGLLKGIANTFPRAIHPLSIVITAESTLRVVESGSALSA